MTPVGRCPGRTTRAVTVLAAAALLTAACAQGPAPSEPAPDEQEAGHVDEQDTTQDAAQDDERDADADADDRAGRDGAADEQPDDSPQDDNGTEVVDDDPSTADEPDGDTAGLETRPRTDEAQADGLLDGFLAVTDVRVGTHDDFDRVTFELEGEATAGWFVTYEDEPTSQGSGRSVEVDGEAYLGVALRNISLPPDLPDGVDRWEQERLDGPDDAEQVVEVVADTIFEGIQLFYLGVEEPASYRIDRLEDPQRVVIDVLHD